MKYGEKMANEKCIAKATGKPLAAYATKKEAKESAAYAKKKYKSKLYVYKCERCGFFHLAPKESKIHVKKNACPCRDSNGQPKALYRRKKDAMKQLEKSQIEQHIKLRVYKCPHKIFGGWHLTHTEPIDKKKK